ncbi:MAG: 3-deoxy-manno-octulosonate cytidylyltransferase [Terriglobales bacterium]
MQPTPDILGVIPARLGSTRLARKALAAIGGKPMIQRVYEGARACARLRALGVATDADEIATVCRAAGIPVWLTAAGHPSGTSRIAEVLRAHPAAAVVNIQGDEPMVQPEMIAALLEALFAAPEIEIATLATPLAPEDGDDPSVVKVVCDARGRALYFSRAAIPYPRCGAPARRKHLGYYAYSARALEAFLTWPAGPLEIAEQLEQLRFLENGWPIAVAETAYDTIGVDTAADLARVQAHFQRRQ